MAWQDRDYNDGFAGPRRHPLLSLLLGSLKLGTLFGIRIRVHAMLVIYIILTVLLDPLFHSSTGISYGAAMKAAGTSMTILFGIVLLHEFGHCFAARWMGGEANDILMSPLGGLAFAHPPRRPWPTFVTIAAGPMVNVLICIAALLGAHFVSHSAELLPYNPLDFKKYGGVFAMSGSGYYLWWIYVVSYALLLFNLLPIFPLDGGQMLQTILWPHIGYYRSMLISCVVGMIGAGVLALVGLVEGQFLLIAVAIFGFMTCRQMRYQVKEMGPYGLDEDSMDFGASLRQEAPHRKHKLSRWMMRRARKRAAREQAEQANIDTILAKVSAHGMHSLTWWEKRMLRRATARQREHDVEMTGKGKW